MQIRTKAGHPATTKLDKRERDALNKASEIADMIHQHGSIRHAEKAGAVIESIAALLKEIKPTEQLELIET